MDSVTKILLGITSLAVLATVLINYKGAVALVNSGAQAYTSSIGAAEKG